MAQWRRANSDPLLVEVSLVDGTSFRATVLIQREKSLCDLFNMPDAFMELDAGEQGKLVVARAAIRSVRPLNVPKADQLERRITALKGFDPHAVLGLSRTATAEEAHDARLKLIEAYHPERFANVPLPPEVRQYLAATTARVEEAYAQLTAAATKRPAAALR